MGQIVCAVVADSDVHAKQAAAKVKIEYEMLEPVILTIEVLIILLPFYCFTCLINGSSSSHSLVAF